MTAHSRRSKKVYGKTSSIRPVSKLQSPQGKSPSAFVKKETVVQGFPREVQAIESVYEYFTKQRPLAWQYFSRTVQAPLVCTGRTIADDVPNRLHVRTLDVNQSLVLNSLYASIVYRPITTAGIGAGTPLNHYVSLETPYLIRQQFEIGKDPKDFAFYYNLNAQSNSLYEANITSSIDPLPTSVLGDISPTDGFTKLGENVLENAESSTALYVFETGDVSVTFTCLDTISFDDVANTNNFPANFFPEGLSVSAILPYVVFEIRGHMINKNDAELLKTLVQNN